MEQASEVVTRHTRHYDIGDEETNVGGVGILQHSQRLNGARGFEGSKSGIRERADCDGSNLRLIVHDEYNGARRLPVAHGSPFVRGSGTVLSRYSSARLMQRLASAGCRPTTIRGGRALVHDHKSRRG